eukprot:scaffold4180_cov99-Cylindrotheca_fusiformis.AAC.14
MIAVERKTVHFNPSVKLRLFRMPTSKDRAAAWYSRADLRYFRKHHIHRIRKLRERKAEKQEWESDHLSALPTNTEVEYTAAQCNCAQHIQHTKRVLAKLGG